MDNVNNSADHSHEIPSRERLTKNAQRVLLAGALSLVPTLASAQTVPSQSPRIMWSISGGLVGASTNLTNVTTGTVPAHIDDNPTGATGPAHLGGHSGFPAYDLHNRPLTLWNIGVPGMINGSVDILWKERFSVGATLGANLLRLPIPGVDFSTNIVNAGFRAAYRTPHSIWDIHAGVGGSMSWNQNFSTPVRFSLGANIGASLYTNRSPTSTRGFLSLDLATSFIPERSEVWTGLGLSGGVQFQ